MTGPNEPAPPTVGGLLAYEMVTRHPTRRGNLRMLVDRDGSVRVQRNAAEPPLGEAWAGPLPLEPQSVLRNAESRLFDALDRGGFFSMAALQVNEAATDGIRRTLTWNGKGGPRSVIVDRARTPTFDALVGRLWRLLGLVEGS